MGRYRADLERCLDDLERRLDAAAERRHLELWQAFWEGRSPGPFFAPARRPPNPPRTPWPEVHINDAQFDFDAMLLSQFRGVSDALDGGAACLCVRCNYGTGILPSLFGCGIFEMARETNTLPTAISLGSADAVRRLVDQGIPDVSRGLGGRVFACQDAFMRAFERHPRIAQLVDLYHPDVQGPIDVAEVVWGSSIFLALYDEPELVRNFLSLVTETYAAFMRRWYARTPPRDGLSFHWGWAHKGRLMLRNDSLMNLPPETYRDLIRPFDQRLLDEFGGGMIHACGRGDHYLAAMCELRGLYGINLSQPHLNDMETVYGHTVDRGIVLAGLQRAEAERAVAAGRDLRGRVYV